ncbi:putative efflux protein, MATE family [Quadrisphaera granulorum]|uniref:Putative MATE family efflux protein n=1 Tax=Quadrisphaera granulorum TaxID=317664 RepID=A0A316AU79_9ACTN|nr:MATE family efflux transporter [Quadrisphaera granulorum]PWJ53717.1 putative MATE family efflux protein [Quadrisphaera granulorum]SZE96761.1 putative efflux protein, MATE family [Quadrisphaera granulorum]
MITLREQDREVLRLAIPALGALLAEPLFLLADSAIVGRLGVLPLAGLGVAGALLATAVSVFVFLAYGTTAMVARRVGAGDLRAALQGGVDGMWLALGLGVIVTLGAFAASGPLVDALGASEAARPYALTYLHWSLPGLPGMLVVLAATGVLRGLQDTTTPLVVAVSGAVVNTVLNLLLVYGAGLGIAGSAAGTALTQLGMAAWLAAVVARGVRRETGSWAALAPRGLGVLKSARDGVPLLVRTLALRAALLLTTYVAARQGDAGIAAHQVATVLWTTTALALDALAIAAQALVGRALGADDAEGAKTQVRRLVLWGVGAGVVMGVVLAVLAVPIAALFTPDPQVREALAAATVVLACCLPLAGWVFVLDGVLIGAGDGRYLAGASIASAAVYAPLALAVLAWAPQGRTGLVWLWVAFAGAYTAARLVTLVPRERGGAWLVTGATR